MAVRVGILGTGFMGTNHGRILRRDPRVELRAVFDLDPARCRAAAAELGCTPTESEEQLFEMVDAVYIVIPNTLHAAAARRALAAGKHIFCEKPFATSLADARAVRDLAAKAKTVFQVGHNRRFAPVYLAVKQWLARDGLRPTLAHFKMNRGELESPPWVGDTARTGGYLYETPLHLLDLARWLFGEVKEMHAAGAQHVYSEPDNFSLLLRLESGLSLTFASSAHATWAFPFERVEVFGRHFTIETAEMERVSLTRGLAEATRTEDFHALKTEDRWGYTAIDANFISAVLGEEAPAVTAEDGYRAVELVDRCYRLVRGG
jgi:myo-inositol 2-dehydrogenase/D-chiro-inositol 1-dehydrogenase